jgi:hypothetical protein
VTVFPVPSVGIRSNVARPRERVANAPQDDEPCDDIAPLVGGRFAVERILADPKDILALRPEVPKALAAIVTRCLQKNRDARFADVPELADALVAFAPEEAKHYAERARAMATASADRETSPTLRMRLSSPRTRRFLVQVDTMAEKLETRDVRGSAHAARRRADSRHGEHHRRIECDEQRRSTCARE